MKTLWQIHSVCIDENATISIRCVKENAKYTRIENVDEGMNGWKGKKPKKRQNISMKSMD